ncbi:NB-ARC domain protein, partial [Actinobacteria bacterium OK074]
PAPAHFTGRTALRDTLLRTLGAPGPSGSADPADGDPADGDPAGKPPRSSPDSPTSPPLAVLSGMAGVGKSALALHVAHALADRFPDGQLYLNLHGATPGMTPLTAAHALTALLRDLGVEPRRIPEPPDAAAALLRSLLAPTRTLVLLDDVANAAQVRPLLPGGAGCAVLVTSRSPLTALDGARRFPLGPLSADDSAALLRAASGRDEEGLDGSHRLVELTGRLPLALRVVAARLAARRALTPDVLAGQLTATEGRLHHLEYDDLSVRRSLAVAHDALRASHRQADRDAALALGRIGALDLPGYGAPLLARLTGTDVRRAEAALDRLVDVALLEETAYGRYAPHDLVRDFAREIATTTGLTGTPAAPTGTPPGDTATATTPAPASVAELALRWYAATAARAYEALQEPGPERDDRLRATTSQPHSHAADVDAVPPFPTAEDASAWIGRELENIAALARRYAPVDTLSGASPRTTGPRTSAPALADSASPYVLLVVRLLVVHLQRTGRVAELEVLGRVGLAVARRLRDAPAEAYALLDLAGLHFMKGRGNDALALLDPALAIWHRLDHVSCLRRGLNNRGLLLEGLGRYEESGVALRQSLQYARVLNDPLQEAITYSNLGNLYEHTDPRTAIDHHRRSLAIGEEIDDAIVRQSAHCNIGFAHLALGEPDAAVLHFEEALGILDGHRPHWQGESQTRLGLVRALRGRGDAVRAAHECAELLTRAARRGDRYTEGLARHQRGLLLHAAGDTARARHLWTAALTELAGTDSPVVAELTELLASEEQQPQP